MNDTQYAETQEMILTLARMVLLLDVDGFLDRISMAHAVGPILDPTLYRRGMEPMGQIEGLANSLRPFAAAARQIQAGAPAARHGT